MNIILAKDVKVGDIIYASYPISPNNTFVCAWVKVHEIKHHTDTGVSMFSNPSLDDGQTFDLNTSRWVEYPLESPLVSK